MQLFIKRLYIINHLLIFILASLFSFSTHADETQEFPVLYQGRYRPADAYARLWLYEIYHSPAINKKDFQTFNTDSPSALNFLWSLNFSGSSSYKQTPLFWINAAELKKFLGVEPSKSRFSYIELYLLIGKDKKNDFGNLDKKTIDELAKLSTSIKMFEQLTGVVSQMESGYRIRLRELQQNGTNSKEIGQILEQEFPLTVRLNHAGSLFKTLPNRFKEGDWLSLNALNIQMFHPSTQSLKDIGNFTIFSDEHFYSIRHAYKDLTSAYASSAQENILKGQEQLIHALHEAYQPLSGKIFQEAHSKNLSYPSITQLKIETLYVSYPWIQFLILLYAIGASILLFSYLQNFTTGIRIATWIIGFAILFHTSLLAMRCYILERPPVSNMFETVIYVPWISAVAAFLLPPFRKSALTLFAASLTAIVLLLILEITDLNQSLDQVQAVLDSQFWLLIHVLLVVGSYGFFILGAIIGHLYLGLYLKNGQITGSMKHLSEMILHAMYAGTAMLIIGTILGGVWAAESWGRFWDWDPKESWAFISSCFYLICIHAFRFNRIGSFGLAIGAVAGLLVISFTWYGVNYILGTGLHSYGFGSGGEYYYYSFLSIEILFLSAALWKRQRKTIALQ